MNEKGVICKDVKYSLISSACLGLDVHLCACLFYISILVAVNLSARPGLRHTHTSSECVSRGGRWREEQVGLEVEICNSKFTGKITPQ